MTTTSRSLLLAASLVVVSTAGGLAQATNDTGAPGGLVSPPRPYTGQTYTGAAAQDPHVAGATGSTIVPGDNSSVAADRRATVEQRTGQGSSAGGGK